MNNTCKSCEFWSDTCAQSIGCGDWEALCTNPDSPKKSLMTEEGSSCSAFKEKLERWMTFGINQDHSVDIVTESHKTIVARVHFIDKTNGMARKRQERACLIAAAPDLYEALNDAWQLLEVGSPAFRKATKALSKAKLK